MISQVDLVGDVTDEEDTASGMYVAYGATGLDDCRAGKRLSPICILEDSQQHEHATQKVRCHESNIGMALPAIMGKFNCLLLTHARSFYYVLLLDMSHP